jgi:calcium/calmodulin-dependent protein kinase I
VGDLGAMKGMNYEELYATDKRLRSGSYGTVYTCHHRNEEGKLYAVKIIDRQKIKKTDDDSVFREVSVLKEFVGVPNIIQLIDFFVGPERLFVVQVLATGGDVFDRLSQRRTYSEENARTLARVLLGAIDAMHHVQPSPVVHRDLKPENLLLGDADDDASILLADFGFARHVTGKGCTTRCGTPAFVAPEVVLGVPYGVSVDLWSIGCLLYMLIGGYPPFNGKHHRELFRKIRASDFVFHEAYFGKVSDSAKNVISSLLTVNRDLRWSARQCLDSDWFREPAENLSSTDLSGSLREIKRFKARRHWKAASVIINWAAAQPFWKPDMVSFSQQMTAWDKEAIAHATLEASSSQVGSQATLASFMSQIPRLRFEDVYELKTQIRKGSYAVVWQGVHRQSGEIFAVKVVQRNGLKPSDDAAVLNEVAIMQQLSGKKYFCQLMDFYEEKEAFYLVMEFMAGGT